jgi:endonuclease VIII
MPEGHTVHRMAQDHFKWLGHNRLTVTSPQGRFEQESSLLSGRVLQSVEARGKHLYYAFGANRTLHVHLGLYGKYRLHESPASEPRGAVRVRFIGKENTLDLHGPNQCELLDKKGVIASQAKVGQDPLRADADPGCVLEKMLKSKRPIGTLLLDQSLIAGIGNIYRAEILFLNSIHPTRLGNSLARDEIESIWSTSVELLRIGVKYNRIITIPRKLAEKPLSRLNAQERLCVYKKDFCFECGSAIESWSLGNRQIYACNTCQR